MSVERFGPRHDGASQDPRSSRHTMTPERWRQVREVFDQAVELEGEARAALLVRATEEHPSLAEDVAFLLRSHEMAEDFIEEPLARLGPPAAAEDGDAARLHRIGPWALEEVLGRGGMGTVYLASRADDAYHRQVAVKVLRRELETRELTRRFRAERQILASLDHPGIARLLDGGTTQDGRPYLVMEYVEGEPVDVYCRSRELSFAGRLGLFHQVCEAVRFAHQSLIVHRDLKPGNILVTAAGQVKLLDFGIAKLLEPDELPLTAVYTEPGLSPMTLEYASPEQVGGAPITTASDVYSLGVVLHELLTGERPCFLSRPEGREEMRLSILEEEPVSASAVAPGHCAALQGDLDNILAKALEKDPRQRYATVDELWGDLERHLAHRPVRARPRGMAYRSRKFLRRHRWGVALGTAVLLALLAFLAALLVQRERILHEKLRAEEVESVLVELFEVSDPDLARGEEMTARDVLARGAAEIPERLAGQPESQARMLELLGRIHRKLGFYSDAETFHRQALELRRAVHGARHPELAASLLLFAEFLDVTGEHAAAEARYREALEILRGVGAQDHPDVERGLSGLARVLAQQDRFEESVRLYGEALAMARRLYGELHTRTAWNLKYSAELARRRGELAEAETLARQALRLYRELYGEDHPEVVGLHNDLALVLQARGEYGEAEAGFRRALEGMEGLYDAGHPMPATVRANLASVLYDLGRYDTAEETCRQALAELRQAYPEGRNTRIAEALNLLGLLHKRSGDLEAAQERIAEALGVWRLALGEGHNQVAVGLTNLAGIHRQRGELDQAEALYREALAVSRAALGGEHANTLAILEHLGRAVRKRGELVAAEEIFGEVLAVRRRVLGASHRDVGVALYHLGGTAEEAGDREAAAGRFREALGIFEAALGPEHGYTVRARERLTELDRD